MWNRKERRDRWCEPVERRRNPHANPSRPDWCGLVPRFRGVVVEQRNGFTKIVGVHCLNCETTIPVGEGFIHLAGVTARRRCTVSAHNDTPLMNDRDVYCAIHKEEFSATSKVPHRPTECTYMAFQAAYDHFNRELFGGLLCDCLITLPRRNRRTLGYFWASNFRGNRRDRSH